MAVSSHHLTGLQSYLTPPRQASLQFLSRNATTALIALWVIAELLQTAMLRTHNNKGRLGCMDSPAPRWGCRIKQPGNCHVKEKILPKHLMPDLITNQARKIILTLVCNKYLTIHGNLEDNMDKFIIIPHKFSIALTILSSSAQNSDLMHMFEFHEALYKIVWQNSMYQKM